MGHCDSPAQFGRHGELLGHQPGTAGPDSARHQSLTGNGPNDVHRTFAASVLLVFLQFYKIFLVAVLWRGLQVSPLLLELC